MISIIAKYIFLPSMVFHIFRIIFPVASSAFLPVCFLYVTPSCYWNFCDQINNHVCSNTIQSQSQVRFFSLLSLFSFLPLNTLFSFFTFFYPRFFFSLACLFFYFSNIMTCFFNQFVGKLELTKSKC